MSKVKLSLLLVGLFAGEALAQNVAGSIQGTVKDPGGAVLANAQVLTWGRITSTVTTSRQIQLGAKLTF